MRHRIMAVVHWLGGFELYVLVGVFVVVAGTWTFIELAGEVMEGDTQALDERIVRAMRRREPRQETLDAAWLPVIAAAAQSAGSELPPAEALEAALQRTVEAEVPIGPAWLPELMRDVTSLGGYAILSVMTVAVIGFLCLDRKYHVASFVAAAVVGGYIVGRLLKAFFDRPRPDVVEHLHSVSSASFPSGHSMMSAVVYLTLGTLLATVVKSRRLKIYFLVLALFLTAVVGVSRVYLGVHYPTDVLAGWSAGLVWASGCWLLARRLQRRGTIERPT